MVNDLILPKINLGFRMGVLVCRPFSITGCLACLCVISFPGSSAISLASGTSTASSSALVPLPERQQQQVAASPVKDCSTIKNEKERLRCFDTATKRGGSEPLQPSTPQAQSTPNKQAALEAIKILRALASAVSIGISYADYRRRLVDAKVAIDQLPIDLSLGAKESFIGKALQAYIDAAEVWQLAFSNKYLAGFYEDSCSIFKKYAIECGDVKSPALMMYVRSEYPVAQPLSIIWAHAKENLDQAQKISY